MSAWASNNKNVDELWKKKHEHYHVLSMTCASQGSQLICLFHWLSRGAEEGHKVAPLYNFCDISGTWRATNFKLCIASNEYLNHIWAKFGGHSSIGHVSVTSQSYIVSRNHVFSDVLSMKCDDVWVLERLLTFWHTLVHFLRFWSVLRYVMSQWRHKVTSLFRCEEHNLWFDFWRRCDVMWNGISIKLAHIC